MVFLEETHKGLYRKPENEEREKDRKKDGRDNSRVGMDEVKRNEVVSDIKPTEIAWQGGAHPVVLVLKGLRQEDCEAEASFGLPRRPCLKKKKEEEERKER